MACNWQFTVTVCYILLLVLGPKVGLAVNGLVTLLHKQLLALFGVVVVCQAPILHS
jgi:hypothetical protein